MTRALVFGLGVAGRATARALARRGWDVTIGDDRDGPAHADLARETGARLVTPDDAASIARSCDLLVPAPGVPPRHEVIRAAIDSGVPVRSEIDLAYEWEQERAGGPRPVLAVTGTDGKTTTTMLAAAMLRCAGLVTAEVGNTDRPFVDAVDEPFDAFVVECSSFRLAFVDRFRAEAAAFLNIAPDHLDWHGGFDAYRDAKARLWEHARSGDVAVVPAGDAAVGETLGVFGGRTVTFGLASGDYTAVDGVLRGPGGAIIERNEMRRSMPHDITNALAAAALVMEAGLADAGDVGSALRTFEPAAHRIQSVGRFAGREWFDDSKATSPHAALTAIRAFDRLVLIAGGRNKDLDLGEMAVEGDRMAAVVAIGDSAPEIVAAFRGICPVETAGSMVEAVLVATRIGPPGVPVVLSPGCTSYDWYSNYGERGDDFQRCVREHAREAVTS